MFFTKKNKISPADAKEQMDKDKEILLVDVRETAEYKRGHIENAVNVPLSILSAKIDDYTKSKDQKIFVYCQSGGRSGMGYSILSKKGYTNLFDLGGIMSWPYEIKK